jgi:DNA-binding MarR family transcriptional regulator
MSDETKPAMLVPLIVADVYELAGRLRERGEAIAQAIGQTQARWQVLSAASAEPKTVPQIARRLGVSRQNVQRISDLLVAEQSASFEDNPDHRGSPFLILSKRGRDALERLTRTAAEQHARLARKLPANEIASIHRSLRRLLAATAELETAAVQRQGVQ